jgi:hypothetical protein
LPWRPHAGRCHVIHGDVGRRRHTGRGGAHRRCPVREKGGGGRQRTCACRVDAGWPRPSPACAPRCLEQQRRTITPENGEGGDGATHDRDEILDVSRTDRLGHPRPPGDALTPAFRGDGRIDRRASTPSAKTGGDRFLHQ